MINLILNDVTFGYGEESVIRNIDLEMSKPELVCIIGPNGVGKSTLVKCINRILLPNSGVVEVDGQDVQEYRLKELAKLMGFVPMTAEGEFTLNVLETVLMGRHPHQSMGSRDEDIRKSFRALKMVGMDDLALRDAGSLSAGQQQRVAIAKGIAQEPQLIILDEPTANLDVRHQILITKMLKVLTTNQGIGVLMISHDLNIAAKYADSIIVIGPPGVVYSHGLPEEVITEQMIKDVYGVEAKVIVDEGHPHVILRDAV